MAGYFDASQRCRKGSGRMYVKTAILMAWLAGSYVGLVWGATVWWQVVPLSVSLALAMAGVGFNVQHDGNHGAYSRHCFINKLAALTLNLLRGRRLLLALQAQHRPPHLSERDRLRRRHPSRAAGAPVAASAALLVPPLPASLRLGPLRAAGAQLADLGDFRSMIKPGIGDTPVSRPRGWDSVCFCIGKASFLTLALVIPMLHHRALTVLGVYFLTDAVLGLVLATVFQLAHCVEEADFRAPATGKTRIDREWMATSWRPPSTSRATTGF